MSRIAATLEAFFSERLITQHNASPRTIAAYRDTFRLLLRFAQDQTGKQPARLQFADLDASLIGAFLNHLEQQRGNGITTATRAWRQSTRSTATRRCATPRTSPRSRA